ncbi:hypothetical protein [Mycoplasma capricolum]|uniref:Membrane protein, putative n=1 Tax=Mycoplasma capricolum subsp. capricolum (strain California kid / ATCC 27343 / NCTC 10154) TaxID=340047 RepID=Q2SSH8_MYCCT|nr:hypothetical protein [Mycoplasma capricolum]ABC01683.1 membrane protein, putative [Mycoplasma capricolum subsp. capricolum ATCC 27343]
MKKLLSILSISIFVSTSVTIPLIILNNKYDYNDLIFNDFLSLNSNNHLNPTIQIGKTNDPDRSFTPYIWTSQNRTHYKNSHWTDGYADRWNAIDGETYWAGWYKWYKQSYYLRTGTINFNELGISGFNELEKFTSSLNITFNLKRYYIEKDVYNNTFIGKPDSYLDPGSYEFIDRYGPPGYGKPYFDFINGYNLEGYQDVYNYSKIITKSFRLSEIKNKLNQWIDLGNFVKSRNDDSAGSNGRGTWKEQVKFELKGSNTLNILTKSTLISESWSHPQQIFVAGKTLVDKIEIHPNFKYDKSLISKNNIYYFDRFILNSETSSLIDDDKKYKIGSGVSTKSNKELVIDEFIKRLTEFKNNIKSSLTNLFFERAFPDFDKKHIEKENLVDYISFERNKVVLTNFSYPLWPFNEYPFNLPKSFEMPVEVRFNASSFKSELAKKFDQLGQEIKFKADYSTDVTDQTIKNEVSNTDKISGKTYGSNQYTNKTLVHKIIDDRIDKLFIQPIKNNFSEQDIKHLFEHTIVFDTNKKEIKVNFISNSKYKKDILDIENNKVKTITIRYEVNGSDEYNKKINLGNGLTLESGAYFDTKSNKFIKDSPEIKEEDSRDLPKIDSDGNNTNEFELNSKVRTYIYHSDVKLKWQSNDPTDILLVNGEIKEPSGNNTFEETFNIPLANRWNDETQKEWVIQILSKDETRRKQKVNHQFIIRIEPAVKSSFDIKNLGWKPDENADKNTKEYNQWLITQQFLFDKDGKRQNNPKFVPNLNKETGFISNFIFVRHNPTKPNTNNEENNFPVDLIDKNDKYIFEKIDINDASKVQSEYNKLEKGFIAEVLVTRGGIDHLFANDGNKLIEKIEKVKVDENTFEDKKEKDSPVIVKSKENNTIDGLWHYRITLKDYIKPEYDQKGIQKVASPIDKIIKQTEYKPGTTIHKYVYINHKFTDHIDQYSQDFLGLEKFKKLQSEDNGKNWKFKDFWQTSQAKHFIAYYSSLGMSTSELKKLDYEQLVYLWKKYITSILQTGSIGSLSIVKQNLSTINDLNLKAIKDKTEVKNSIEQHILNQVNLSTDKGITLNDLKIQIINNSVAKELNENTIPNDFIDFKKSKENKKIRIKVDVSDFSTILKRNQSKLFTVTNSLHDLTSLNNFLFNDINTNFDNLKEQEIKKIITTEVSNQVNSKYNKSLIENTTKEKNVTLTLGVDYEFFLANKEETEQQLDQKINKNLKFSSQNMSDLFIKGKTSNYRIVIYALNKSQYISSSNKKWFINNDKKFINPNTNLQQIDIKELFKVTDLGWINKKQYEKITSLDLMNKLLEVNKEHLKTLTYDNYDSEKFLEEIDIVKGKEEIVGDNKLIRNHTFDIISKKNSKVFKGTLTGKFQSPNSTNLANKIKIDDIFIHNTIIKSKNIEKPNDKDYFWEEINKHFKETISRLTHKPNRNEFDIEIKKINDIQYQITITAKNENKHFTGTTNIFFIEALKVDEIVKPELPGDDRLPNSGYEHPTSNDLNPDSSNDYEKPQGDEGRTNNENSLNPADDESNSRDNLPIEPDATKPSDENRTDNNPENATNTDEKWWEKEDEIPKPFPIPKRPEEKIKEEDKWILGFTKKDRNWIIAAGISTLGIGWVVSYFWWRRKKLLKKNKVIKTLNKKNENN